MCVKVILKNGEILMIIPDCYKDKKVYDNAVGNYTNWLGFVPDFYKVQEICNKAVSAYPSSIQFVSDWYKTQ